MMNNKHAVVNQFRHGVNYNMNQVKMRKTAVKPTWFLINLMIELKQVLSLLKVSSTKQVENGLLG